MSKYKCDVIGKNPAYGGVTSVFKYQPFPYINKGRSVFLNCTESEKSLFCRWSYARRLIRPCTFSLSISRVFLDNVNNVTNIKETKQSLIAFTLLQSIAFNTG